MEAVECGAAALATVLGYFGRYVPLEQLREECGVSRDGSKASNILKAARRYGVTAKGFKFHDLTKLYDVKLPCILFWNLNHFVVLDGFKGDRVFINDPAQGPRVISHEEFSDAYSGVVLTFEPGEDFEKGGFLPRMWPALRRRLAGSELALTFTVLAGLFLVIPGLVIPTFSRVFIDEFLVGGQEWLLRWLFVAMGATLLIQGVLKWLQEHYLLRLETKLALTTSSQFFNHILRLPANYFSQRYAGEIGSRVQINDKVASVISGQLAATTIDLVMTVFYALLMFLYDWSLTLIVIGIALLNVIAVKLTGRLRTDASRRLMQDHGKVMGTAMSGLQMIETLKATGSETEFFSRWAGYHAKTINGEQQLGTLAQFVSAVPSVVQTMSTVAVLGLGGLRVMDGEMTAGMLIAYQTLLSSFTRPLYSFVQFGALLQELKADMNRLDDVIQYPQDAQYAHAGDTSRFPPGTVKLSGHVELRNVTFGYSPLEPPLIDGFDLMVQPGQRVAVVGASGSGKSTVAKLLAGLYAPWTGDVLFDGVPRKHVPRTLLVNSIGVVDQEIFLFGGTVRDNVVMWDHTIPVDRVAAASRDAEIADVVESREGTYQTTVEERGGNFSGGQCQRLEIARSLVAGPSIVILDEATSALDPTTEVLIDEAMRRRGCTCIIVAHRLSTIKDCDEIVVMQHGKIVQRGTHEEMKDIEGPYRTLITG
jgi:NHLM bacteriocin system ABC transporter peptidase/ATP-binding protein